MVEPEYVTWVFDIFGDYLSDIMCFLALVLFVMNFVQSCRYNTIHNTNFLRLDIMRYLSETVGEGAEVEVWRCGGVGVP